MSNVLVAVDFSKNSVPAACAAASLCRALSLTATLLYVAEPEVLTGSTEEAKLRGSLLRWARDRLERIAREDFEGVEVTTRLLENPSSAEEGIVDVAEEIGAELIVMGTHGRTAFEHRVLGSTATSVVRHAKCDVLSVRPPLPGDESFDIKLRNWVLTRSEGAIDAILCPTDFSEGAQRAEKRAAKLAKMLSAELHLLHVVSLPFWVPRDSATSEGRRDEADSGMAQAAERAKAICDRVKGHVVEGTVHEVILERADTTSADLVVMGTDGDTGLKRWAIGSDAERVVRSSTVPVLTVRRDS